MKVLTKRKLILATFVLWLDLVVSPVTNADTFVPTGAMTMPRSSHTATLLPNGKVLITGGGGANAELFDPATGTWSTTGSMSFSRRYHTATLLGNGKVLIVGGSNGTGGWRVSELYDPTTGTWTDTGWLATVRYFHTATLLPNGRVLVTGGENGGSDNSSAEVYDPLSGSWSATGTMSISRRYHTATLLVNGKVLVAGTYGGYSGTSGAELYDPATGVWTATGPMSYRYYHTATLLPNGKVLVAGGYGGGSLASAELYDPTNGTWSATGAMSSICMNQTAILLASGKVLVAGGSRDYNVTLSAELYNPTTGTWVLTNNLNTSRIDHTATLLPNGRVLVAGGTQGGSGILSSAELYDPSPFSVFAITLNPAVHGSITGNTSPYLPNATATLNAVPSPGYLFTGWTGDAIGMANPLGVFMDSDQTIGANFIPDTNDDDHDGLTNYQEIVIYHTDFNKEDTDDDGFFDGYEVFAGKSPRDILDHPALVAEARTAIEFTFPAARGKTYRIEASLDLATWDTVENGIAGTGEQIQRFYTTRNMPKRYFRVEEDGP